VKQIEIITSSERRREEKERWVLALEEPGAVAADVARRAGSRSPRLMVWNGPATDSI